MEPIDVGDTLIEQVYRRVVDAIADGTLLPGMRIRQGELAEQLGVSRQPVSHALHLLHRQGLLQESGRKGFEVAPVDPVRIGQFYEVRAVLDALAARLAAERRDQVAIAELERVVAEGQARAAARRGDEAGSALLRLDMRFHQTIYRASGNPVLAEMTGPHWLYLARAMAAVLEAPAYRKLAWAEHEAILGLIRAGDAAGAEIGARDHAQVAGRTTARRLAELAAAA